MEKEEIELAYFAGLLDGDGSFFIGKEYGKVRKEKGYSPCYTPIIALSEVGESSVNFLKKRFGGYIGKKDSYVAKDGGNRNSFSNWRVCRGNPCLNLLKKVIPFLVIKKDRAIELQKFIENHVLNVVNSKRISQEELDERENFYVKIKQYNSDRIMVPNFNERLTVKIEQNDMFWSYIAGIFDSDGAFCLNRSLQKQRSTYSYVPVIILSQIDHRGIEYVIGGFRKGHKKIIKTPSCTSGFCYSYSLKSLDEIKEFCEKVIPFLKIKKERARLLLEFCNIRPDHRYTDDQQEKRESIFFKLKQLNMGSINLL